MKATLALLVAALGSSSCSSGVVGSQPCDCTTCFEESCHDGAADADSAHEAGDSDSITFDHDSDVGDGHALGDTDEGDHDSDPDNPLRIFPGAYGYGSESRGAYQLYAETGNPADLPRILYVDTLDGGNFSTGSDSWTLKWCLSQNFPCIILFKKAGLIDWASNYTDPTGGEHGNYFTITELPYCNIYGQSAPWPGITITNGGILLVNEHDYLIQHLRFRIGDTEHTVGKQTSGIAGWSGNYNIVIDHCSFSWSIDQLVGFNPAHDITLSNSIFAEPLNHNTHPDPGDEYHAMANTILRSQQISVIGNLYAHCLARTPFFNSDISNVYVANNLMYNIQNYGTMFRNEYNQPRVTLADFVGNYYVPGFNTQMATAKPLLIKADVVAESNFYVSGNYSPLATGQLGMVNNEGTCTVQTTVPNTDGQGYTPHDYLSVPDSIAAYAGAFYWHRDQTDIRVLSDVENGTGTLLDSINDLDDTFLDDIVEATHTLNLPADPHGDTDEDGYTNLEEWVAGLMNEET